MGSARLQRGSRENRECSDGVSNLSPSRAGVVEMFVETQMRPYAATTYFIPRASWRAILPNVEIEAVSPVLLLIHNVTVLFFMCE